MNKSEVKSFFENYIYELLLLMVFLAALSFRFYTDTYHLLMVPDYDGYQYVKIAKYMAKGMMIDEAVNWTPLLPTLIALFSFLPLPLDQIGSLINIFFGALTVFPIYLFVKNIINKEAAFFSVLIYAFHPQIAFVNVQVMSETTYIFMIFMFAWAISEVLKGKLTVKYGVISGLFGGLIYLGRPEGVLIFIALTIFCFLVSKDTLQKRVNWFFTNVITFTLTILPYSLFLRSKLSKFVFSGKSKEILPHIRNMMGVPEKGQSYLETFSYDFYKTYSFIKNNLVNAWLIITEEAYLYALIFILLLILFVFAIKKSQLALAKGVIFFISMLLPVSAALIFKVDQRYLSPTSSVLAVMCGIGIYGGLSFLDIKIKKDIYKIILLVFMIASFSFWGFYKIYHRFEKEGELNVIYEQERLYKRTGLWLKGHIPSDSTIISVSTNYLIAYYAGDLPFKNVSKSLTESEVIDLVCSNQNQYLVINDYAISRYYKNLSYLLNPYSQSFNSSPLYDKIMPVYYDDIAMVAIYTCKSQNVK
ncbi:MAG: hypothetical protein OHK0040_01480 [bacterium]